MPTTCSLAVRGLAALQTPQEVAQDRRPGRARFLVISPRVRAFPAAKVAPTVAEKYDHLYSDTELEEIARAAGALNGKAERVHVAMNNNRRDYPVINGLKLKEMLLEDWHPPARERLIEEFEERRAASKTVQNRSRGFAA
jgi:uncharacterized protein YecE (DUF72 family)